MPAIKPVGLGGDPASWPAGKASSLVKSLRADRPAPLSRAERIRRFQAARVQKQNKAVCFKSGKAGVWKAGSDAEE
jgi:hypothetical protein